LALGLLAGFQQMQDDISHGFEATALISMISLNPLDFSLKNGANLEE
jgi:hypothetical protein